MNDGKIHIKAKKMSTNPQGVIKLCPEAHAALIEVVNETSMSIRQVASEIILQAVQGNLICYDREVE